MRAWRAHSFGAHRDVLRLDDGLDPPGVPDDGVRIQVQAAALNFPDLLSIAGQYRIKGEPPFIPGLEVAGVVSAAGAQSRWSVGDKVIAFAQGGAFAEEFATRDGAIFAWPDGMPVATAAALTVTWQTSWLALAHRGGLQAGETLLVHGAAGGVGLAALQIGKAMGATVIATCGGPEKVALCKAAGADHVIDYRAVHFREPVMELTGGRGVDVVYDPVGGEVFDNSLRCLAWEGRLLVIGFAGGAISKVGTNRILLRNISVVGVYWGEYTKHDPAVMTRAHEAVVELWQRDAISPHVGLELPFEQLPDALDALQTRGVLGKAVVTLG